MGDLRNFTINILIHWGTLRWVNPTKAGLENLPFVGSWFKRERTSWKTGEKAGLGALFLEDKIDTTLDIVRLG